MMRGFFKTFIFFVMVLTCVALFCAPMSPPPAQAKDNQSDETNYVSIDFDDVDIRLFIKFISKLTHKNFIVDNRVKGKVTIISPSKISVKEAYQVFESVLETHGYATVASGEIIKILPRTNARADNLDTRMAKDDETADDKMVTRLIPLEYADSQELHKLFIPLLPKGSILLSYRDTNMIIVTASLSTITRLLKIIRAIDVPNIGKKISIVPVRNADAVKLAKTLTSVFTARTKGEKGKVDLNNALVYFTADERTNCIILLASKVETQRATKLIKILDQEVPKGEERIRVYYLEHALAEDLAQVLQKIPTQGQNTKSDTNKTTPLLSSKVNINADPSTNALIIMAEKEDYPVLEEVISKLDIPRAMVYIECLIMEVNVSRGLNIGTEWQVAQKYNNSNSVVTGGFGGTGETGYTNTNNLATNGKLAQGFSLGVLGKNFSIGGITFTDIKAVVQAFQSDEDVHILSNPQILTTENEEAVITVGQNVPYQTQSAAESGSATYSSYEYKDVGISLKITPRISKDRMVRLDVYQELTKMDSVNQSNPDRPTTLKRQIETTIIVEDSNSVVIGGLIDETMSRSNNKMPCLGEIPVLGWAFKTKNEGGEKTNLYVFLTPRVIKNPLEAGHLYDKKKLEMDSFQKGEISLFEPLDDMKKKLSGRSDDTKTP